MPAACTEVHRPSTKKYLSAPELRQVRRNFVSLWAVTLQAGAGPVELLGRAAMLNAGVSVHLQTEDMS